MKDNISQIIAIFATLAIFLRLSIFVFFTWTTYFYYGFLLCFSFYSIHTYSKGSENFPLDKSLFAFITIGAFSIMLNDVNPNFHPWLRLLGFTIVTISFGPLLVSQECLELKYTIFDYFKFTGKLFCVISLFIKIAGVTLISPLSFGLSSHDMTMAPIAFMLAIITFDEYIHTDGRRKIKLLIFLLCLSCGMLTGSRSAIGSFLLAFSIYILLAMEGSKKVIILASFSIFAFLIYTTNPFGLLDHFNEKMNRDSDDTSYILSGRDLMIQDRIEDFCESPVYGVGFASMKNTLNSKVNFAEGIIESGSSWFLILGSTGLLGLLLFIQMVITDTISAYRNKINIPIVVCIIYILAHCTVEGYIISFGNSMCAIFFLFLSLSKGNIELCKTE